MAPNVEPGKPTTFVSMRLYLCLGTAFVSSNCIVSRDCICIQQLHLCLGTRDCIRVHGIAFVSMEKKLSQRVSNSIQASSLVQKNIDHVAQVHIWPLRWIEQPIRFWIRHGETWNVERRIHGIDIRRTDRIHLIICTVSREIRNKR
jgi:hypothetical protein